MKFFNTDPFRIHTRRPVRSRTLGCVLVLVALAATGCGRKGASAQPSPPPPEVTAVTLQPEQVTITRELPGRTNAYLVAEVRPQVTGIVQERLFTEGSLVKAGQPLYQLDDAVYRAEHARAEATAARAKATLELARLNAKRSERLAQADAVSQQENESALAALAQTEAEVGVAQAALQAVEVTLGYTRIVAPIAGQIGKSAITPGALVTANQPTPLATIQQLDPIYVDLSQSSREFLELRKSVADGRLQRPDDMPVRLILEDGTPFEHAGKLAFSEVTVNPATGSFSLRVVVPNPDHLLLPGMYVRADIGTGVRESAILVPQQGVARDARGNTSAMVITQDGKVELRAIQVSRTVGDKWLVEGGLVAGDRVIVEGLQKVRPGMPVRIAPSKASVTAAAQ